MTAGETPYPVNWKKNLVVVWLSQFLAMAGFGCCMPFVPLLLRDNLHIVDDQIRGLCVSVYFLSGMISFSIACAVWGTLADRFGRKIMLLRASYAAAFFYPMLAFAPDFWSLLLIRFICSFFSGTVNPAQTLLVTTAPPEKHSYVLGILGTAFSSGHMAGYMSGGFIVEHFGYTAAFLTCGAVYLAGGLLVQFCAEERFARPVRAAGPAAVRAGKRSFREMATPGVRWLMTLFFIFGVASQLTPPFMAMQVERVSNGVRVAFFTGTASAAAAFGGVCAGMCVGRLCGRFAPGRLMFPVLALGALMLLVQAFAGRITVFICAGFLAALASASIQPLLQIMLTWIIRPELRGTYLGWSASLSAAGGIACSFVSGAIAYWTNVRGVFAAAAILLAAMIPMMIPADRACRKESRTDIGISERKELSE